MTERMFPTDEELDELMGALPGADSFSVATLDQLQAATREAGAFGQNMALAAIARGGWALLGDAPKDTSLLRRTVKPRLKMLLAAFSTGQVAHLCGHTRQIRPMMLSCDPPSLVCMAPACIAKIDQHAMTTGFRWDNHCDGCGNYTETVTPYLTMLGPLTISGHLCQVCGDAVAVEAVQAAGEVQVVSRKSPCPCGSGRRFKRCHGRQEAA